MNKTAIISSVVALFVGIGIGYSVDSLSTEPATKAVTAVKADNCVKTGEIVHQLAGMRDKGITQAQIMDHARNDGDPSFIRIAQTASDVVFKHPDASPASVQRQYVDYCLSSAN